MPNFSYFLTPEEGKMLDRIVDEKRVTSKTALVGSLVEDYLNSSFYMKLVKQCNLIRFFAREMRAGQIPQQLQNIFRKFNAHDEASRARVMNILIKYHDATDMIIDELIETGLINKNEQEAKKPPVQDILNIVDDTI